jgi:hypothetical protein
VSATISGYLLDLPRPRFGFDPGSRQPILNGSDLVEYAAHAAAEELVSSWDDWLMDAPSEATPEAMAADVDKVIALLAEWRTAVAGVNRLGLLALRHEVLEKVGVDDKQG